MRKAVLTLFCVFFGLALCGPALAAGPSGSSECHIQDDDCDTVIDEDTGTAPTDDNDGDGLVDEDSPGDTNGDGNPDDDGDGLIDEDPADDDGDGLVDEDPVGDAADDAGENQVNCNEETSQDVAGAQLYAGSNGVELCNEGGLAGAVEGRAIATTDDGGYVAIDGDGTNPAPADGYARVDQNGFHCGDENNLDSGASQDTNTQDDCG